MPDTTNETQTTPVVETTTPVVHQDPPPNETATQKYARLYSGESQAAPDIAATLAAMRSEIAELKNVRVPNAAPAPGETSDAPWVEAIRKGDFKGAEDAMLQRLEAKLNPRLEAVRQEAYQQAASAAQITQEVNKITSEVRNANPDILAFEDYLQAPVNNRIQLAREAGRINTPADFLREYRAALDGEVTKLRNLGLQFRAAGKDEATTRVSDVTRSTPLTPQQVTSNQQTQTTQQTNPQGESTDDYFSRRRASENRNHGLF